MINDANNEVVALQYIHTSIHTYVHTYAHTSIPMPKPMPTSIPNPTVYPTTPDRNLVNDNYNDLAKSIDKIQCSNKINMK